MYPQNYTHMSTYVDIDERRNVYIIMLYTGLCLNRGLTELLSGFGVAGEMTGDIYIPTCVCVCVSLDIYVCVCVFDLVCV